MTELFRGCLFESGLFCLAYSNNFMATELFDVFKLFDGPTVDKIKSILQSIDPEKIKCIMDTIQIDKDGWLHVQIDLKMRKK